MSGGVDSSVAAALLVQKGYEVIGVMLRLWAEGDGERANRCCSPQAVEEARAVAAHLGISFYLLNVEEDFRRWVVEPWIQAYGAARTPNPCISCNRYIKFGRLLEEARALGAEYLATGHYARIERRSERWALLKGLDDSKDQSYALYALGQEELARALFPVGAMTKSRVVALAGTSGLPKTNWEESQDICFLRDTDYRRFLGEAGIATEPGPILDLEGKVLGTHHGLANYTIGQRQGLGLSAPWPLYVVRLDRERNVLVVGRKEDLLGRRFIAEEAHYPSGQVPRGVLQGAVKVRYRAEEAPASLVPLGEDGFQVDLGEPQSAITPGQAAVFYQGDEVVAGGTIAQVLG